MSQAPCDGPSCTMCGTHESFHFSEGCPAPLSADCKGSPKEECRGPRDGHELCTWRISEVCRTCSMQECRWQLQSPQWKEDKHRFRTEEQVFFTCRYHDVDAKNYQLIEHLVRKGNSRVWLWHVADKAAENPAVTLACLQSRGKHAYNDCAGHKQLKVLSNSDFSGIHLTKPH